MLSKDEFFSGLPYWQQPFAGHRPGEGVEESLLARVQELRAENERLRDVVWKHGNRADEAEAENERLRAEIKRLQDHLESKAW